jgi:AcrR family transcriptional regulator
MVARLHKPKPRPRRAVRDYARSAYTGAILDAAERLFLRVGYHDAKMADLAAEAGVAVGTLYNYFASKDEVFGSLAARSREELFVVLERCLDEKNPLDRLRALVEQSFAYAEDHGALLAIYMQLGAVSELQIRSAGGESAEQGFDKFLVLVESLFRDGVKAKLVRKDIPVASLAAAFAGAMNATLYKWIRSERAYSLVGRADPMLRLFLEGARAK